MRIKTQGRSPRSNQVPHPQEDAGTSDQPRLSVFRSVSHIYVQVIDDMLGPDDRVGVEHRPEGEGHAGQGIGGGNIKGAELIGKTIAERLKEKGITKVVSIATGSSITGACAPSPKQPARRVSSSDGT